MYTNTKLSLEFEINRVIRCLKRGSVKCYSQHDHHKRPRVHFWKESFRPEGKLRCLELKLQFILRIQLHYTYCGRFVNVRA